MSALDRLKEYIDYKGISIKRFEESVGFSNGSFGSQLRNKKTIGVDKLEYILSVYPEINTEWLLTGKGSMLKGTKQHAVVMMADQPDSFADKKQTAGNITDLTPIPLINPIAIAKFGNPDFQIAPQDIEDYYVIPKFKYHKVDFMIEVSGSSMYPKYNSGDIIACTIIRGSRFIQWNKCYVIATREQGVLVKRIKEGKDNNNILAVSENKEYPPFEIPNDEITGIAIVVGVIMLE
ncbi:Phage repressor protein C, contains Cro/C1-type HTH and peptisase s24 domains [Porphyromonadaceae bacterium KH3CP3RA]|nr:Phage repressor protein C, contains Cro/C1-type HTH and peptisase s24 domains [Porphyromonadaceae bacterium KH3CP3RA]